MNTTTQITYALNFASHSGFDGRVTDSSPMDIGPCADVLEAIDEIEREMVDEEVDTYRVVNGCLHYTTRPVADEVCADVCE